ncbi:hypothetical protein [Amycolatopsis circi]|uniref:hypothetical protein n=1 Tax=Amycolatopsis circi TaxID=871959 RepID=UPI0013BE8D33|nr:hypothetical protein [Amycolatopsis circi]
MGETGFSRGNGTVHLCAHDGASCVANVGDTINVYDARIHIEWRPTPVTIRRHRLNDRQDPGGSGRRRR